MRKAAAKQLLFCMRPATYHPQLTTYLLHIFPYASISEIENGKYAVRQRQMITHVAYGPTIMATRRDSIIATTVIRMNSRFGSSCFGFHMVTSASALAQRYPKIASLTIMRMEMAYGPIILNRFAKIRIHARARSRMRMNETKRAIEISGCLFQIMKSFPISQICNSQPNYPSSPSDKLRIAPKRLLM